MPSIVVIQQFIKFYFIYNLLQTERLGLRSRIEKKAAYLEELEEQVRNLRLYYLLSSEFGC